MKRAYVRAARFMRVWRAGHTQEHRGGVVVVGGEGIRLLRVGPRSLAARSRPPPSTPSTCGQSGRARARQPRMGAPTAL
eukprot:5398573-Pleurochrysis_carterae.AAC.1